CGGSISHRRDDGDGVDRVAAVAAHGSGLDVRASGGSRRAAPQHDPLAELVAGDVRRPRHRRGRATTYAMTHDLRRALVGVPDANPVDQLEAEIADSVAYLASDAALRSVAAHPYWPKWSSPWWHMLLLHELGEARRIPARTVDAMV